MTRLDRTSLPTLTPREDLVLPSHLPADGAPSGIVHFGIGAFHRAHQAVITQAAMEATGDDSWWITGVTQRSDSVRRQLAPQDGLYTVLEKSPAGAKAQVISAVREVIFPAEQQDRLDALLADPALRIITLTVTEKGYRRRADGRLDLSDPLVAADIAGGAGAAPASAVGRLARGLQGRARAGGAPITVVCCDNLTANGEVLERLVRDFAEALPAAEAEELTAFLDAHVRFPSTMVDRIVPATTDADRTEGRAILGLEDAGLVVAEPFLQWVVEDSFAGERPAWEQGGAQLTADVAPFELMKLRTLNGAHSTLAYLGALRGHETIAESVADPQVLQAARDLIAQDVIPTLTAPDGTDLVAYGETVLERFANPALAHRTVQIAMDGSQKLPLRLLGTIRDRRTAGAEPLAAARGVAAWMAYVASDLPLDDPIADRLAQLARGRTDAGAIVENLLGVREVFGEDLPADAWLRGVLRDEVACLLAR
ncbi:mannitol dehydrogenase [Brachybacterium phenoliresistens]|uniref:Mannitol-1-phosphate 5-dehydrogenase n=1 Tax=Brachybacterium phenoliresistens TaxID=396014 RepID=Z9JWF6_9MICO|nr:mannitol dehydrogenase family protein [Brachybacterium phenoliresistens]EWS82097.1 mannitol dehydrogenase [Brachybacterium phenoliresistens]